MQVLKPNFDLREEKWHTKEGSENFLREFFDPSKNYTTDDIRVPEVFRQWMMGQKTALRKLDLIVAEWYKQIFKVQKLEDDEAKGIVQSKVLKEFPSIVALLVGKAGTGKSLFIKIVAEEMKKIYDKMGIKMQDVIATEDKANRYQAKIRYLKPAGIGRKLIAYAQVHETQKGKSKMALVFGVLIAIVGVGMSMMALGFRDLVLNMIGGMSLQQAISSVGLEFQLGSLIMGTPMFVLVWLFLFKSGSGFAQYGENLRIPNLLVDNSPDRNKMYESITLINDSDLFGGVEWGEIQSSSMAKPPYRRLVSGAVQRRHKQLIYVDEGWNLTDSQIIKLLTVIEDGECPIAETGQTFTRGGGGTTAGQNVKTPAIKSMFLMFIGANLDFLFNPQSPLNKHPPFRDRVESYGDIILFEDEAEATAENMQMMCQVIRDELYRFQFPRMEALGCKEIIDYVRTKASDKHHIKVMFRTVIKVLKKSAQLSWDAGDTTIRLSHVKDAIENYTASIEAQLLDYELKKTQQYSLVENSGAKFGQINALAVVGAGEDHEGAGDVMQLQGYIKLVDDPEHAEYIISMQAKVVSESTTMVSASKADVRTAIYRMYGIDIAKHAYTHIKYSRETAEGPSAGITMTELIMFMLGEPEDFKRKLDIHLKAGLKLSQFSLKPIPIRQDIGITGEINITEDIKGDVKVSAIGGAVTKARGARRFGLRYVIVPTANFENNIVKYDIVPGMKLLHGSTTREYFEMLRGDMDTDKSIEEVTSSAEKYLKEKEEEQI